MKRVPTDELAQRVPEGITIRMVKTGDRWFGEIEYETTTKTSFGAEVVKQRLSVSRNVSPPEGPKKLVNLLLCALANKLWPEHLVDD